MNILVLAPHTDDEILCSGTLAKYKYKVHITIVAFSYPKEIPKIRTEFFNSCKRAKAKIATIYDYPIRKFCSVRQEILETMVSLSKQKKYDLVFCPCSTDTHQDHEVIHNECFRAFKDVSIWGYQAPHNCITFHSHIFVSLSKLNVDTKINMSRCYKTQSDRPYFKNNYFESLALSNGMRIKESYAEVFENIRTVIR
jgi:LmbE family N-acetylglucosaminyl deacetylase